MKRNFKLIVCCILAAPLFVGCDDDDDDMVTDAGTDTLGMGGFGGTTDGGTMDALMGDANLGDAGDPMPLGPTGRPATVGAQIDRVGRPAISTATIATFAADMAAKNTRKDAYNAALPGMWMNYAADIKTSLGILDALDGNCGNQLLAAATGDRYKPLADVLADDQLYVNSAVGECGVYLGAEAEFVSAVAAGVGKCGGRTPQDDVIDRSYSVLGAGALSGVTDGIDMDDATHSLTEFPFLAAP